MRVKAVVSVNARTDKRAQQVNPCRRVGEVVDQHDAWRATAELISDLCKGAAVIISGRTLRHDSEPAVAGVGRGFERNYAGKYTEMDPWLSRSADLPEGTLCYGRKLLASSKLMESEFYVGWMKPQRLDPKNVLVGVLSKESGQPAASIRIFPRVSGRGWSDRPLVAAQALTAHLSRLLRSQLEVALLREERNSIAGALDALPQPVILVDADSRVVGLNASARQFLSPQSCVGCPGCTMYTSQPAATAALHRAVTAVVADSRAARFGPGSRVATVSCPNGRASLSLSVSSLGRTDPNSQGVAVAAVVVRASRGGLEEGKAPTCLFCLTPAEARLARCLAEGWSLKEAAVEFHVSIHTVRMQLRSVFVKTGTRRQGDLVRLILTG